MKTTTTTGEKAIKTEIRILKSRLDSFGVSRTPERNEIFNRYCEAQKSLGTLQRLALGNVASN